MIIRRHQRQSIRSFVQDNQRCIQNQGQVLSHYSTNCSNFFNPTFKSNHIKRFSYAVMHHPQHHNKPDHMLKRRSLHKRQNILHNQSQMVNYILGGVKQKYKEIYRQKSKANKDNKLKNDSELYEGISLKKQAPKNYDCFKQSLKVLRKQIVVQNLNINLTNKRLITAKNGRMLKSAQRNTQHTRTIKNDCTQENEVQNSSRKEQDMNYEVDDGEDDYLKSQTIIKYRLKYNKNGQYHNKTQAKSLQKQNSKIIIKFESEILANQVKYKKSQPAKR